MYIPLRYRPLVLIALFAGAIAISVSVSATEINRPFDLFDFLDRRKVDQVEYEAVVNIGRSQPLPPAKAAPQKKQIIDPRITTLNAAKRALYRAEGTWARYDKTNIEGCPNAPYSIGFSHECLIDFSKHPDKPVEFAPGLHTTVAFAGQWMQGTYEELWDRDNTCGFALDEEMYSPRNQEIALTCKWWKAGALDALWSAYTVDDEGTVRFMREHLPPFADRLCTIWAGVPCAHGDGNFNTPEYGNQQAQRLETFIDWMVEELAYEQRIEDRLQSIAPILFPIEGYDWNSAQPILTSGYKWRWGRWHRGIDFDGGDLAPIVAPEKGWIEYACDINVNQDGCAAFNYGNFVVFRPDRDPSLHILYFHLDHLEEGMRSCTSDRDCVLVVKGQRVGRQGNTGFSKGSHLHVSIGINQWNTYSEYVDPTWYLKQSIAHLEIT